MSSNLFLAVVDKGKADGLMRSAKAGEPWRNYPHRPSRLKFLLCLLGLGIAAEILLTLAMKLNGSQSGMAW